MDRLFLDANVLFSAALNPDRRIGTLWRLDDVRLLTCPYALLEAMRNIAHKYPDKLATLVDLLQQVEQVPDAVEGELPRHIRLAEKDRPILLSAIASEADYLLTGDYHFDGLFGKRVSGLTVLPPGDYLSQRAV